jgi:S-DNA-T family DNA segregation ATPase FtsK/SpoIIIE
MSRINGFVADVEQATGISGIRVLAPIQGSTLVGFEVPRSERVFPKLPAITGKGFDLMMGQTITGDIRRFDVRMAPHILVAGSSGSGKSVFLHSVIRQLLKIPNTEMHLFDPKQVELFQYDGESRVVEYKHNALSIASALESLVQEMETRYDMMKEARARSIEQMTNMKYKFVIIDEYADLALRAETDNNIQLLAQKGRSCGIHLIVATQRASTKIISGDVKINFPVKVVFRMSKEVDSRVMLDQPGAEKLLGKGDCLFASDAGVERLQAYLC